VATNRYSVPVEMIGRRVEVRESKDTIEIYEGPRLMATHPRIAETHRAPLHLARASSARARSRSEACRRRQSKKRSCWKHFLNLAGYVRALKEHSVGRGTLALRRLLSMVNGLSPASLCERQLEEAAQYGLYDLDRVETVILRKLGRGILSDPF